MDVWIDFKHASKWQAECVSSPFPSSISPALLTLSTLTCRGIFLNFFPCRKASDPAPPDPTPVPSSAPDSRPALSARKRSKMHAVPLLEESELQLLAKEFAAAIPENELSVASLQGYLLKNKTRPRECVREVGEWIEKERETRAKLKREKEEREREAKAEKEREEKEVSALTLVWVRGEC